MHTADETAEIARELANVIHRIEKLANRYDENEEPDDIMSEVAYLRDTLETWPADRYERAEHNENINSLAEDAVWITRNLPDHTSSQTYARSYLDQFPEIEHRGIYRPAVNRWELTSINIRINYAPNIQLYYSGGDTVLVHTGEFHPWPWQTCVYAPHLAAELAVIIDTTKLQAGCQG